MAKTKEQKTQIIENLKDKLARKKAIVLLNFKGLKVEESEELRKLLREKQIDLAVTKNTLLKIILNEKGISVGDDVLSQPLALAFSYEDEVIISKEISLFAKEHEALTILGGILDEGFVSAEVIEIVSGDKDNIVTEVLRKGYKLNDKILQVAQVKVSKKVKN